jgi:hypothetical protein
MTNPAIQVNTVNEAVLTSGGITLKINGDGNLYLYDAEGKEIADVVARTEAMQTVSYVFPMFGEAFHNEAMKHQKATVAMTTMSGKATAAFAVNDNATEPKIGFVDDKGWRYAGISKTTGTRLWVAEKDSEIMSSNKAVKFTQELKGFQGYDGSKQYKASLLEDAALDDGGVRLPTKQELNQLYENKADLGNNFDSSDPWYWSSSEYNNNVAYIQCRRADPQP